ncbi:unnamed protein product [Spodoptera littoralis]|uniref:MD-2-related lipid-recognition domain-containing protein n=1 Tax=Spodoptera littoralis TaxID=7109 RepID=A0A9P0I7A7_SPOLI|nr:unnamed protein product [Spodoptera littoralis]CAH1641064.1 unnamed protein product [Spodoptera littoralis]
MQLCNFYNGPLPINTYIVGYITPPCVFPLGQDAVINIKFRARQDSHAMQRVTTLATEFVVILIPYTLEECAQTCNYLANSICPLEEGEVVLYSLNMFLRDLACHSSLGSWMITTIPWCFSVYQSQPRLLCRPTCLLGRLLESRADIPMYCFNIM